MQRLLVPTVAFAVLAAACGGGAAPAPVADAAAEALATRAESIATALDEGRACEASTAAEQLLADARARFEAGELSEPALGAIVDAVESVEGELTCAPDAPSPAADSDEGGGDDQDGEQPVGEGDEDEDGDDDDEDGDDEDDARRGKDKDDEGEGKGRGRGNGTDDEDRGPDGSERG